jgi:hypothetical protein
MGRREIYGKLKCNSTENVVERGQISGASKPHGP